MAFEEEHDRLEGVWADLTDILLGDFGKGKGGAALEVDIVAVGEGRQCLQGLALEEVRLGAV